MSITEKEKAACAKWAAAHPDKVMEKNKRYYAAHPDKSKQRYEKWKANHPKEAKERYKKYRAANLEKTKAAVAKWAAENVEYRRIRNQNRKALRLKVGGELSKGLAEKLFRLQKGLCACCAKPLGKEYHLDHIMPLALGGEHADSNMQLLRARCNLQKHAKHPVDFMQERGFLL